MFDIRPFKLEDTQAVKDLFKELTDKPINFIPEILLDNQAIHCRVLESEGDIIGFAALTMYPVPTKGMIGRIEDVVVSSVYRGGGLGRKLMEDLIEIAKKEQLVYLNLTSNPKRIAARNLYESMGFQIAETGFFWMKL
ncbi:MAG: GNAT family N-acetyltransferase [Candidatus Moraniibacteriota bacterium]